MPTRALPRRQFVRALATAAGGLALASACRSPRSSARVPFRLATFTAEITPPLGHALMGGGIPPAQRIDDPLFAHGLVLLGEGAPIVLAVADWCEIRNDAYDRWRTVLAEAAGTEPQRVLVTSVHQHDAPVADLEAQRILTAHRCAGQICDVEFHERAVQRVGAALRASLSSPRRITHFGTGQARVEKVASNRRYPGRDGKWRFDRTSSTRDPLAQTAPEGTIDPWLKTLSFWEDEAAVAALSCYATHPMSFYGKGGVSADFVGLARRRRHAEDPSVFQIYLSGCSGNVTAGKYNTGAPENRTALADRMDQAMTAAWKTTARHGLTSMGFRTVPLRLEPRTSPGFTLEDLNKRLGPKSKPFDQCLAALGLSWRKRTAAGRPIDVPVIDFGAAQFVVLPAESYVEFQLLAQSLRPDSLVVVAGYGECAPGYIPIERAWEEGDTNLHDWCWVDPGAERALTRALEEALKKSAA